VRLPFRDKEPGVLDRPEPSIKLSSDTAIAITIVS